MAAAIPGAQFVAVPETGHAVFVDDPATFNRALQGLLDSVVGAKKSTS
jgi:pimeloyl-ACP methyl ester carboxylesterase